MSLSLVVVLHFVAHHGTTEQHESRTSQQVPRFMSAEAPLLMRSWRVGKFVAEITVPRPRPGEPVSVAIEWTPCLPSSLSPSEMVEYRSGRDAALQELARLLGGNVGLVEV